jgi:hypothetical protein
VNAATIDELVGPPVHWDAACLLALRKQRAASTSTTKVHKAVRLMSHGLLGAQGGHIGEEMHKLESRGLVTCTVAADDPRGSLLWSLTKLGRTVADELAAILDEMARPT